MSLCRWLARQIVWPVMAITIGRMSFSTQRKDSAYTTFNDNAIQEIQARKKKGDFVLFPMGNYNKPVADAHQDLFCVESGIGYQVYSASIGSSRVITG